MLVNERIPRTFLLKQDRGEKELLQKCNGSFLYYLIRNLSFGKNVYYNRRNGRRRSVREITGCRTENTENRKRKKGKWKKEWTG